MGIIKHSTALATVLALLGHVLAGPGATIIGCVYFDTAPTPSYNVTIAGDSGRNQCMNQVGNTVQLIANSNGWTCESLGYVEAKTSSSGGDTCATDRSLWNINYFTSGRSTPVSGNAFSRWWKHWGEDVNEMHFLDHSKGSMVCADRTNCGNDQFTWTTGTAPAAYVIFQPETQQKSSLDGNSPVDL